MAAEQEKHLLVFRPMQAAALPRPCPMKQCCHHTPEARIAASRQRRWRQKLDMEWAYSAPADQASVHMRVRRTSGLLADKQPLSRPQSGERRGGARKANARRPRHACTLSPPLPVPAATSPPTALLMALPTTTATASVVQAPPWQARARRWHAGAGVWRRWQQRQVRRGSGWPRRSRPARSPRVPGHHVVPKKEGKIGPVAILSSKSQKAPRPQPRASLRANSVAMPQCEDLE
mmetsp:Transcript_106617/g.340180  ORF Transcript_106617/g.340180 Transcript_106617/m.340180 type:complete len:233 (+) Transcript_106617:1656-2354(+)